MTALNVLIYPDDHLKIVCEPVVEVNDDIRKIVDDMFDTCLLYTSWCCCENHQIIDALTVTS